MTTVTRIRIRSFIKSLPAHLKSLAHFPPVRGGKSFDTSNVVEEFIKKSRQ